MKLKTKIKNHSLILGVTLLFLTHQIYFILKGGTTWDDLEILLTSERVLDKAYWNFVDRSNPFLGDYNFNLEYYGYLVPIIVYLLTLLLKSSSLFVPLLGEITQLSNAGEMEITYMIRYIVLNFYVAALVLVFYRHLLKIDSKNKAALFCALLYLVPSFSGHALFNIKDIPFALHYFLCVLVIINYPIEKVTFDSLNIMKLIYFGVIFGTLVLVRFNGYAFLLILSFYKFISTYKVSIKNILNLTRNWLVVYATSFTVLILGSPSSWYKPHQWLKGVYETQFNIKWGGSTLTNGTLIPGDDVSADYLATWFLYKMPINLILGFMISIFAVAFLKKVKFSNLGNYSIFLTLVVFTAFSVVRPISYDGIRQYIFLIPFFVYIYVEMHEKLIKKFLKPFSLTFLIISFTYLLLTQGSLEQYKYVYFNEFVNEESITSDCEEIGGCGIWETDYWGYSGKQLMINNTDLSNIQLCEPINVFQPYTSKKNISQESKYFYIASIHRTIAEDKNLCQNLSGPLSNCKIHSKETVFLRGAELNLSYIYRCY